MLYTPHFLVGAVIMKYVPNPAVGLPLAFISHILMDMTPHNDFDIKPGVTLREFFGMEKKKRNFIIGALITDYLLTVISFIWVFFKFNNLILLVGGIAAILPDAIEQFLMVFDIALPGWQDKFQFRVSAKYGFISYPIFSIIAIYFIIK